MNSKVKISAVVCTYNSEEFLEKALASLSFADEIVVVDDGSSDSTLDIARKFTNNIFKHKSVGYVEPARNFAISKATGEWVLLIDADEEISDKLAHRLLTLAKDNSSADAYELPRKNIIFGKWIQYTGWWPDYQIRFFRKNKIKWSDVIHSVPEVFGEKRSLAPREEESILHNNYQNISQYISRMDRYTTIEAQELINQKYALSWSDILTKPHNEFNSRFFALRGYKDGLHGLVLSILQAFSVFVLYLKIWEKSGFPQVDSRDLAKNGKKIWRKSLKDLKHWIFETMINENDNPLKKSFYRLKRKIS